MTAFNLEAFKAGQKASTRSGQIVTFVGICDDCAEQHKLLVHTEGCEGTDSYCLSGMFYLVDDPVDMDIISMVSRHQHLIDSYDPEDTWRYTTKNGNWTTTYTEPEWDESTDYRLHHYNELIKAHRNGAKIEQLLQTLTRNELNCTWVDCKNPLWNERVAYRIKPAIEKTIHCLAYDAENFSNGQHPSVVEKTFATASGWRIIQEWEV